MPTSTSHYDVIIIGSGPGGGAVAHKLAPSGKRILILERGGCLPREPANWDADAVFKQGRYRADETWRDKDGTAFSPMLHYWVGGNSKMYGSALLRLRREDFWRAAPQRRRLARLADLLRRARPLLPRGRADVLGPRPPRRGPERAQRAARRSRILRWSTNRSSPRSTQRGRARGCGRSTCRSASSSTRCPEHRSRRGRAPASAAALSTASPASTGGKADAEIACIRPTLRDHANVTLLTGARVERLETDASRPHHHRRRGFSRWRARALYGRHRRRRLRRAQLGACCSCDRPMPRTPNGLANSSDQVGRNYMRHVNSVVLAVSRRTNETIFQKTLASTDFYFGTQDWPHPMGFIQMCGKLHAVQVQANSMPRLAVVPARSAIRDDGPPRESTSG